MDAGIQNAKLALRDEVWARMGAVAEGLRAASSRQICERLRQRPEWASAKSVLLFAPISDEPDIWPLVAEALTDGKQVALPRFVSSTRRYAACEVRNLGGEIEIGTFGIREPTSACPEMPLDRLDFVLIPGIAFDLRGRRLGRGRGFYDRLLAGFRGLKCGVAFDDQIVAEVPVADHDARMDFILTPTRWVKTEN